jgi:signal transduction histidine kinase
MADELAKEGRRLVRDYEAQGVVLRRTTQRAIEAEQLASIATLVAGVAHEIGTPMGVIHGHAKMLESAVKGEDAEWRLKTIQEQIGRISRIIQTLLNMARPRMAQRMPVSLEPLIETTFSFLTEKLTRRGIRIERSFKPVTSISGDPERLQQCFLNLFLNAADAMPDGGVLRVGMEETEDGELEIRVADSGTGIPPEDLERIFNPFFTTKEAGEGNGLGLMVCKGIISDHGGSIGVVSTPGTGTEFQIALPVPEGTEEAAEVKEG